MYHQTTLEAAGANPRADTSFSYGVTRVVREVMGHLDLCSFLDGFKESGVPLGEVVESMCVMHLSGCCSMNAWSGRCNADGTVTAEMTHGRVIGRKTYERCLERLDRYFEEVTRRVNDLLWTMYPDLSTDVYVDGSHIPRAGCAGENVRYGEGGGTVQLQDQFVVAQLISSSIPVMVELYPGNQNDPQQYSDFIPQLMFLLKRGSTIVIDHGGSSANLLRRIRDRGDEYVTRMNLNASDLRTIRERVGEAAYVGHGSACVESSFESSGRTNYLFFSVDTLVSELFASERGAERQRAELDAAREAVATGSVKELVKYTRNRYVKVVVRDFVLKVTLDPWVDRDFERETEARISVSGGWFKPASSRRLPPEEVLRIYRHRVAVEHLISSLKSVVNLDPLRVWKKTHERGALLVGMISQLIVSIVRYEMTSDVVTKMVDGMLEKVETRPSFRTICDDLRGWTMTVEYDDGVERRHECNVFGCAPKVREVLERLSRRG